MPSPDTTTTDTDPMLPRKWLLTRALLLLAIILLLIIQDVWFPSGMRLILLGLLLLGLIRWTAALILLLVQLHLYAGVTLGMESNWIEPMIVVLTIFTLMVVSRLRSCQQLTGIRSGTSLLRGAFWLDRQDAAVSAAPIGEAVWVATVTCVTVAAAGFLLQNVPEVRMSARTLALTPSGLRTITIGLMLFAVWILIDLPLKEIHWKQIRRQQAGVWLRSQLAGWFYRDLKAVEHHRRRLHHRISRRQTSD